MILPDQKLGTIEFLKKEILGLKELEMDFGVLNLAIEHVRVLIH